MCAVGAVGECWARLRVVGVRGVGCGVKEQPGAAAVCAKLASFGPHDKNCLFTQYGRSSPTHGVFVTHADKEAAKWLN